MMGRRGFTLTEQELGKALACAIAALRSYQYGNGSPDLAASTADACATTMREAELGHLLLAGDAS